MTAQQKPPGLAGTGGERTYQKQPGNFTRKSRPAYAKQFRADQNGFAVLRVGWPTRRPPAGNVVALPPDVSPVAIDWRILKGLHVFVAATPGALAPHDLLRELGAELVAAGVASMRIFDGAEDAADWWRTGRPEVIA